ncbi:hypothetical protein EX895_003112 [Sporisorium graminicola]|uniref:Uncharacterized protein n=1 Tax=Sporisorium graminicola TaxID=280036 RepID=A0A4U7KV31_9BASI|nr:hypothetical protein EX895_003112 [Sporisorium graminicola]TKY88016.1 hypothetical protein EX895_003112 [Sporisorium graminicola]
MQVSDPPSVGKDPALGESASQQNEFEILSQHRVDTSNERTRALEACRNIKEEKTDRDFDLPPLVRGAAAYESLHLLPSYRASGSKSQPHNSAFDRGPNQDASSLSSTEFFPGDWSPLQMPDNAPMLPSRDAENRSFLQQQLPPYSFQTSGSVRTPQHSNMAPSSSSAAELDATLSSTRLAKAGRSLAPAPRDNESSRLRDIEESINCFWLVSELRMSQVQDELKDISARVGSGLVEKEQMSEQMAQVLPLQVEIAQKVVRAAEDRRVIYGRIKLLEEASAAWQKELKTMLEAMQAEFRAGMELVHEFAAKGRKPPPASKTRGDTAATATAAAAAAATATTPASTTTTAKNNKRASPSRKKTNLSNGKKAKLFSAEDEESAAPSAFTAVDLNAVVKQGISDSSHGINQQQQHAYDQQQQQQQQQHYMLRSQPAVAWSRENHSQAQSQPMLPSQTDLALDQVQLAPRPRTAVPFPHDFQPSVGSFEIALRR